MPNNRNEWSHHPSRLLIRDSCCGHLQSLPAAWTGQARAPMHRCSFEWEPSNSTAQHSTALRISAWCSAAQHRRHHIIQAKPSGVQCTVVHNNHAENASTSTDVHKCCMHAYQRPPAAPLPGAGEPPGPQAARCMPGLHSCICSAWVLHHVTMCNVPALAASRGMNSKGAEHAD